jgi:hypothetical protein
VPPAFEIFELGDNVIAAFLHWLNSWIFTAGPRRPDLISYYPAEMIWGKKI